VIRVRALQPDWRSFAVRIVPGPLQHPLRRVLGFLRKSVARARLAKGVQPISAVWGSDRGLSIHRRYLWQFLTEFASDVRGHCMEFQHDSYTTKIGGPHVTKLDILHIDDSNPRATIVADLTRPNDIPSDTFDCIICTHVLHVVPDLFKAVSELYRILKPGGVLLVGVPQLSMCDPGWHELWRFTPEGLTLLLGRAFAPSNVVVRGYGNSLASAYEIRGLAAEEVDPRILDYHDQRFAIEVCGRAMKSIV
jgi:SAM-dependent methyltransferase